MSEVGGISEITVVCIREITPDIFLGNISRGFCVEIVQWQGRKSEHL